MLVLVLVLVLSGVAYRRSQNVNQPRDPGLTTELALFITYLMGVLAVVQPALGAGAAVVVAVLLAWPHASDCTCSPAAA